jgi:hypothetical protein
MNVGKVQSRWEAAEGAAGTAGKVQVTCRSCIPAVPCFTRAGDHLVSPIQSPRSSDTKGEPLISLVCHVLPILPSPFGQDNGRLQLNES